MNMKPKRIKKDKSDFVALIDLRRMISEIMMYHMARYSRITKTDALEIAHDIILFKTSCYSSKFAIHAQSFGLKDSITNNNFRNFISLLLQINPAIPVL